MNLLIVDDEPYAIEAVRTGVDWNRLSFDSVFSAESFSMALEIFKKYPIDVLLCDIEMPNGNGLELVEWVRTNSPDTQCIFLTCHDEFNFAHLAIKLDCFDYVLKPALPDMLEEVFERACSALDKRRREQVYSSYGKKYLEVTSHVTNEKTDIAANAENYIRRHIQEQFSLEELAASLNISTDHLSRIFKKKYQKTVISYITELRMNMALEMLRLGNRSLSDIALEVGYTDYAYFSRTFKKMFGKAPKEFMGN